VVSSFIPSYSIVAAPLFNQPKKDNRALTWSDECESAWKEIKLKLTSAPIMGFADYTQPLYMHTDACKTGFAAVLTQERGTRHILIDAVSRTTTPAEKNYSSAKLECTSYGQQRSGNTTCMQLHGQSLSLSYIAMASNTFNKREANLHSHSAGCAGCVKWKGSITECNTEKEEKT